MRELKAVYTVHNIEADSFCWTRNGEIFLTVLECYNSPVPGDVIGITHKGGAEPREGDPIVPYRVVEAERAFKDGCTKLHVKPLGGEQWQGRRDYRAELQKLIIAFDQNDGRVLAPSSFFAAVENARAIAF
jgi:hypothetical protein